MVCLNSVFK